MSVNKASQKAPNLRFKGFTDDWEERKLGDIANYRNGKAHEQVEDKKGSYTIINSKFISTDGKVKRHTNQQVSPMFIGELAIVLSDLPNGKALSKVFLINKDNKYTLNQRIAGITPNENINSNFLKYRMNRHKYFLKFDSGVSQTNLSKPEVENFVAFYPCSEEQDKIGNLLSIVDNLITLHQRKLDQLKQLKEALLQQMFPGKGETVPKLRFAGFEGEWEERKVKELFNITRGQVLATSKTSQSPTAIFKYPVFSSQTKNEGLMGYYSEYLFENAITWTTDGANAGTVNFRKGKFYSTNVNGVLLSNDGYANKCVAEIINRVAWKYVSKVGNPKLMNNVMSDIIIKVPNLEEQNVIGKVFEKLDNTIALQQRKLDQLQNMKQVLLQNMFI